MANRAIEMRSPAVRSMSISRPGGIGLTCLARSSSSSVVSPMAETTTQTSWPALRVSTILRATRLMLSASVTDDPPYFWTTRLTRCSRLKWTAERPVYGCSSVPDGSAASRDLTLGRYLAGGSHRDDEWGQENVRELTLNRLQPPPVGEHRQQHTVGPREHFDATLPAQSLSALGVGATGQGVLQSVERDRRVELARHPVHRDLELHGTDSRQDRRLVTAQVRTQHLHDALVVHLLDATPELLVPAGVLGPRHREVLGRERRNRREGHRPLDIERVTDTQCVGVDQTDDVAREGTVDAGALATHDLLGVLRGERTVGHGVGDHRDRLAFVRICSG